MQCLNMLTSGDQSPVKVCLRQWVMANVLPSGAERLVILFSVLVVVYPCGLPIREEKVILLQVWKAKGNLEQHLFGLCWLDKSFSQM